MKAYEYEHAVHVTLPSLDHGSVKLVGVREAYGPYLRRAVHSRSALHCGGWNWELDYRRRLRGGVSITWVARDFSLWSEIIRHESEKKSEGERLTAQPR